MRKVVFSVIKCLSVAFLTIGTVIGAGFASGRELWTFFNKDSKISILVGIFCGILFFLYSYMFFLLGEKVKIDDFSKLSKRLSPKFSFVFNIGFTFCYIVVISSMMSGIDSLFSGVLSINFPLFSILSFALSTFFVIKGIRGLKTANAILVPCLIAFILVICSKNLYGEGVERVDNHFVLTLVNAILYVSMNMLLASVVLIQAGGVMNKRERISSALISSVIISFLIVFILMALSKKDYSEIPLPLIEMSKNMNKVFFYISATTLYLGIFTTLLSAYLPLYQILESKIRKPWISIAIILVFSLLISRLGFIKIVAAFYPIQSVLGLILAIMIIANKKKLFCDNKKLNFENNE